MKTFQEFITQEPLFLSLFKNEEDVFREFNAEHLSSEYKILFGYYSYEDYNGKAYVLAVKDGNLYEVDAGHCSCYGLEDQFHPELIPADGFEHYFKIREWSIFENTPELADFKRFCGL